MKPIIGILCGQEWRGNKQTLYVHKLYTEAIASSGGIPILLPITDIQAESYISIVQGLVFPGGIDVDPLFYQEEPLTGLGSVDLEWDENDLKFCRKALERDLPILGICRGHQLLNVACGGTLYQDIYTEPKTSLKHGQEGNFYNPTHKIKLRTNTLLYEIFGVSELRVNTSHHQAVKNLAPGFIIAATAQDNIVEAIESKEHTFVLGLQWHPEWMYLKDRVMLKPFQALCKAAALSRRR